MEDLITMNFQGNDVILNIDNVISKCNSEQWETREKAHFLLLQQRLLLNGQQRLSVVATKSDIFVLEELQWNFGQT